MQCDIGTVARKKVRAFNCELSCPLSSGIYQKFQDNLVLSTEFITAKSSFQLNGRGHDCALGWYRTLLCRHNNLYIRRCNLDVAPDNSPYITSQSPSEQKQTSLKENLKREFSRHNNFVHFFRTLNL